MKTITKVEPSRLWVQDRSCSRTPIRRLYLASALLLMTLFMAAHQAQAATIQVNTTDDSSSGSLCSLRSAIRAANTNTAIAGCVAGDAGVDTILLPTGFYALTIVGQNEDEALTGDLDIHEALVIRGEDRVTTIIDGAKLDRIFDIAPGIPVTLTNLTLQNGRLALTAGSGQPALAGGAIYNAGLLTMAASAVVSSSAPYSETLASTGGAIYSSGPLYLDDTAFHGNQAQTGGALYAVNGQIVVTNSHFVSNQAEMGGAIYLHETSLTTISQSQILSNTASANHSVGGGIVNAGVLTLTGALVAHNSAYPSAQFANPYSQGGGIAILAGATLIVSHATIEDNHVWGADYPESQGGGIYNAGSLHVEQSRIMHNSAGDEGGGVYGGGVYRDVEIEYNVAGSKGGGLYGVGDLTNVTLSHNVVGEFGVGAGGYGCGELRNVTISNNHTGDFGRGGGIGFDQTKEGIALIDKCMTLQHVTVISNSASSGAGLLVLTSSFFGLTMENTVIVQNEGGGNCRLSDETVQSLGGNYVDDLSCEVTAPTDRQGELPDPLLGPLADNGGMTQTHMPQEGSPLIDSGHCIGSILTDQRDAPRPQGYGCDIGAVEAPGPFLRFLPIVSK